MDNNENNFSSPGDDEKMRREMEEFLRQYWNLRAEMKRLEKESKKYYARRTQFLDRFIPELQELVTGFYPEYKVPFLLVRSELFDFTKVIYDEVVNLCCHYLEEKPGYYYGMHEVKFKITTSLDGISKLSHASRYPEILKVAESRFEEEYVSGFWHGCYEKHIHLLLKKILPEYIDEIYQLPAEGFRELEGFLFLMLYEILEVIEEGRELEKKQKLIM